MRPRLDTPHLIRRAAARDGRAWDALTRRCPDDGTGHLGEWSAVHDWVEGLPEDRRALFDLPWYHELPPEEAGVLGLAPDVLRTRWVRARVEMGRWRKDRQEKRE